jgi:pyroglutamyl-peptidase
MMTRLLVTGFGPFPLMPRNPSAALARSVARSPRWRLNGVDVTCRILTTAYAALPGELDPLLADRPDAVLLIGVAGRETRIRVERRGTSRRSMLFPDVAGAIADKPRDGRIDARWTRLAPVKALRALRSQALPSRISRDAGRYLCNASYYRALALPCPVVFIHIPKPPKPARRRAGPLNRLSYDERLTAALVRIGELLVTQARSEQRRGRQLSISRVFGGGAQQRHHGARHVAAGMPLG